MNRFLLQGFLLCVPIVCQAGEGDIFLETGPLVGGRNRPNLEFPGVGFTASVLSGIAQQTEFGLRTTYEHQNGPVGGFDLSTLALQGWRTIWTGAVRPQIGANLGLAMDAAYNTSFHLGAQARAMVDLSRSFRLYAGGSMGSDLGDHGSTFGRGEFGTQIQLD